MEIDEIHRNRGRGAEKIVGPKKATFFQLKNVKMETNVENGQFIPDTQIEMRFGIAHVSLSDFSFSDHSNHSLRTILDIEIGSAKNSRLCLWYRGSSNK